MKPLRVAFLWHFHQPYYRYNDHFLLPWVRLHGVKDYCLIPQWFAQHSDISVTFNVTPALIKQFQEYSNGIVDRAFTLSSTPANELSVSEKEEILKNFFLCTPERMILPYDRYRELYEKRQQALSLYTEQDWRDLQTWYNLTWAMPWKASSPLIESLVSKGRNFTEEEKHALLRFHLQVLQDILPLWQELLAKNSTAFSVSPFYHPILPLLCDTNIAQEASPDIPIPHPPFQYPQDAKAQILKGIEAYRDFFHTSPLGMWPPEGAVSRQVLQMMAEAGIRWCATDEHILHRTTGISSDLDACFPYLVRMESAEIIVFFRNHTLSDLIGFVYSQWSTEDAVSDFLERLRTIRKRITEEFSESALDTAVVSIILDGENCWEHYPENGKEFIDKLCTEIRNAEEIETVTFDEIVQSFPAEQFRSLPNIHPGSWINANFDIWIGHTEDNRAWTLLNQTREFFERYHDTAEHSQVESAYDHILIAEGSDWFWWYGDDHTSANDPEFDQLFRWNLQQVYRIFHQDIPESLAVPIEIIGEQHIVIPPEKFIAPELTGSYRTEYQWEGGGYYDARISGGVMHRAYDFFRRLRYGTDGSAFYFRIETAHPLQDNETVTLFFVTPRNLQIIIGPQECLFRTESRPLTIEGFALQIREVIDAKISLTSIGIHLDHPQPLRLHIAVRTSIGEQIFPPHGSLLLHLL